jgi:hypothetical protein
VAPLLSATVSDPPDGGVLTATDTVEDAETPFTDTVSLNKYVPPGVRTPLCSVRESVVVDVLTKLDAVLKLRVLDPPAPLLHA